MRKVYNDEQRERLIETVLGSLEGVVEPVLSRVFDYWRNIDQEVGDTLEARYRETH